jgi:hypothetical protein
VPRGVRRSSRLHPGGTLPSALEWFPGHPGLPLACCRWLRDSRSSKEKEEKLTDGNRNRKIRTKCGKAIVVHVHSPPHRSVRFLFQIHPLFFGLVAETTSFRRGTARGSSHEAELFVGEVFSQCRYLRRPVDQVAGHQWVIRRGNSNSPSEEDAAVHCENPCHLWVDLVGSLLVEVGDPGDGNQPVGGGSRIT